MYMSTGIKIVGGSNNSLSWNISIGHDVGFSLEDTSDNILEGNIAIGKEVLEVFGQEFKDVAIAVQESRDYEALAALASVIREPQTASLGWSVLITKFGTRIGEYDVSAFLVGILSSAAWDALKMILRSHGISI
jgi:parallel beta-helix repeat protein